MSSLPPEDQAHPRAATDAAALDALQRLYVGPLADLPVPQLADADQGVLLSDLLEAAALVAQLERFAAARYPGGDLRGVASQWSKWQFNATLVPALLANLLLDRELPLAPARLRLSFNAEGRTGRLLLADGGTPLADFSPGRRFAPLIDVQLRPVVEALAQVSGASPRVFWSNAGNAFENIIRQIARHPAARPDADEPARQLLERRHLTDGRRNPLYRPIHYVAQTNGGRPRRVRRLCCIRYLIDGLGYCGNCPLEGR
jgi:ferric iron reductase protein FhuF